jgi:predicted RecA/RadA family phage recombinase
VAQVVVSGGGIISATVVSGGGPFNPQIAPTFGLTEVPGLTGANLLAELFTSSSLVTTFDSTAISYTSEGSLVRGIGLCTVTAAQITAGAWVVIQESGIGQLKITTATSTVTGAQAVAANNGVVTTQAPVYSAVEVGFALQKPAASAIIPVKITIPVIED